MELDLVAQVVEKLWQEYDKDNSGMLDKDESRAFILSTLADMGVGNNEFTDEEYEECFLQFDKDGSG